MSNAIFSADDATKKLPLGESSFEQLRRCGQIYVDKTALIYSLANARQPIFLSRPRRFGKTLLVSIFESLFKNGLTAFKGLDIEKLWKDRTYPVIHLDFSDVRMIDSLEDFKTQFGSLLVRAVEAGGLKLPALDGRGNLTLIDCFDTMLGNMGGDEQIVLLIDEYDAPLNCCLDRPQLFDAVQKELTKLYDRLKKRSGAFRFMFITGICRYSSMGIFTGPNTDDISVDVKYGTLLGYTEDEIRKYFGSYVEHAAAVNHLNVEQCIERMRHWYDGCCFDCQAKTHVFTPWSVLNFLKKPENGFLEYWYESAGIPTLLLNYMKNHSLKDPTEYGQDISIDLDELKSTSDLKHISDTALLAQTGYLSIKEAFGDYLVLNYPNAEIAKSMARLYRRMAFSKYDVEKKLKPRIGQLMANGDPENLTETFNVALGAVPYDQYAITSESAVRMLILLYLSGGDLVPYAEMHNSFGRSDLELQAGKRWYVFEFKYASPDQDEDFLLEQAVSQLQERRYGEQNHPELTHVRMALVFSSREKRFTRCRIL